MEISPTTSTKLQIVQWQRKMFWMMWITYASYYLCRVNISVVLPEIEAEFAFTKIHTGLILSSLFFMYAIGQFINGQLGDKINARKIITIGLIVSALLNIFFGFVGGVLGLLMVIWGLNGYFQAMGWGPTVKAMANWFPFGERGKISGRLATSYIIGSALSWLLAGIVVRYFNWRFTFFVPAAICMAAAIHWYVRAKNAPEEVGLPCIEDQEKGIAEGTFQRDEHIGFRNTLRITLMNPYVWLTAMALFGINIVRYGFMGWAPTYMFEEQGATISMAAYKAVAFPVAGGLGSIFAGWASDRYFQHRKAPIAFTMLILLAVFCYIYRIVPGESWVLSLLILLVIGFLTFGPHMIVVTALPVDLGSRKAASSVTGFVDCMGYIGAGLTGVGTGYLIERFSWDAAFYFWIVGALIAAVMIAFIWKSES